MKMNKTKAVYLMISQTGTKFAKSIRKVGKQQYNHSSIALDADLRRTFGFARPQHNAVLMGKLVRESLERYTLGKDEPVEIVVFKIPVTEEQYNWIKGEIALRLNDKHYMYNLFSVLKTVYNKHGITYMIEKIYYSFYSGKQCPCRPDIIKSAFAGFSDQIRKRHYTEN